MGCWPITGITSIDVNQDDSLATIRAAFDAGINFFDTKDGRCKYPMFSGDEWQKNQDFLDVLRALSIEIERPVSQIVLNWTIQRPGITAALCGAKRPHQIRENAESLAWSLTPNQITRINAAITARGPVISKAAVS